MINYLRKFKFNYILIGFLFVLFPPAVHAYAGPGVALAAVVVCITVIFTFFASTLISLFNLIKKAFSKISDSFKKDKKKVRKKK